MKTVRHIRALVAALFVTVASLGASAQRYYEPKFYLGAKGGATMSSVAFTPHVKQSLRPGMLMGITARYTEEKIFGLIGELNIEQRGWKENFEGAPFSYNRALTYISLPVMSHIYFGSDKIKGFVNLGASVSYMVSDKINSDFDYANATSIAGFPAHRSVDQMALDVKNRFDYGITGGAGMEFIIRKKHSIILEGRYYFGLGSIFPSSKKDEFSASRCTSIQISLGYMFRVR